MATRMEIFIGLTFYLILASIMIVTISTAVINGDTTSTGYQNNTDITEGKTGLYNNAQVLWSLITIDYDTVGGSAIIFLIFVTIPFILWWIVLASFIIPTTNAGG